MADTARLLAEHFPALFGAGVIEPIKLRIQVDIHQRAPGVFTRKALSVFLQRHTTATACLRALVAEGATRIDLDGQPVGEIATEHREAAGLELERPRAFVEAKKLAGREAARAARHDTRESRSASRATGERPVTRDARSVQPGTSDRPERSAQPSRPGQAPRRSRPPPPGVQRGPGRPGDTGSGAPRRPHKPLPERNLARAHEQEPASAPALPLTPEQAAEAEARHQRAMLLRSFEQPRVESELRDLEGAERGGAGCAPDPGAAGARLTMMPASPLLSDPFLSGPFTIRAALAMRPVMSRIETHRATPKA
ncbi:MAG: ProQ/FinO family protein [Piscinibacter sp.]|nr:ProQ/FinO family protein [Piscinibacter sp.]